MSGEIRPPKENVALVSCITCLIGHLGLTMRWRNSFLELTRVLNFKVLTSAVVFELSRRSGPCSYRGRIFCQAWRHAFGDVTRRVAAEYFAEHLGKIFCRWQMRQMWPGITVAWTFDSVLYCLSDNFQHLFLHIPSVFPTVNLTTSPE